MEDAEADKPPVVEENEGRIAFSSTAKLKATVVGEPQWMSSLPLPANRPETKKESSQPPESDETS